VSCIVVLKRCWIKTDMGLTRLVMLEMAQPPRKLEMEEARLFSVN
jgi:hypothetical protein